MVVWLMSRQHGIFYTTVQFIVNCYAIVFLQFPPIFRYALAPSYRRENRLQTPQREASTQAVSRWQCTTRSSAGPKRGCLNVGAWKPQESGRKAPLSCNAAFSMLQCSFSVAAAQLMVQMTSALQKSQCCSAVSAAQHSENCSATSVFACGMLQVWGLEGSGLGLAWVVNLRRTTASTQARS